MENDGEDNHHHVSYASCDSKQESTQEAIEKHDDYSENSLIEEVVFGGTIDHEEVIQSVSAESETGQKRKFSEMFEMSYSRASKMTKLDKVSQSQLV